TVTINVSRGPKLVKVPVLVGAQRDVAVERIRGRGLEPSVSEEESAQPAGKVLSQSPDAGEKVDPGSTVSIVVSSGEAESKVPNVIGKERREAVEAIRAAGLVPVVEEEETEVPSKVGRVIDQFPAPGQELPEGSEVTLTVGKLTSFEAETEE
ncbi:MAG TPA: PASTA domain-containing protein, partial [Solirubrobacterales bacterium]|nr:PASTA domain-containing protein [Solirubrobacterales bacterium]